MALVGPDGAGKSTVCAAVVKALRLSGTPASSIYMGVSTDSADRLLPSTRLARRVKRHLGAPPDSTGPRLAEAVIAGVKPRSVLGQVRAALRLANRLAEESQRELTVRWRTARGQTVVVDRHYRLDYHATDITMPGLPWDRRIHGRFLRRALRCPDLVVHLHAPPELLHRRKGEGTVAVLAARQREYDALAGAVPRYERVSVDQPLEATVGDVLALLRRPATDHRRVALVTDADRGSSVAAIRSLDAAGWRVIAAATDGRAAGLHSRCSHGSVVHAHPATEPELARKQLADAVDEHGVVLVLPVTDEMIRLCRSAPLPASTVVAVAAPEAYETASDKWATVLSARRLGIPVPGSVLVDSLPELEEAASRFGWPLVLKPRRSVTDHDGRLRRRSVNIASGPADLVSVVEAGEGAELIVQEFHPGVGVGVELLLDEGRVVAAFQHRRLREYPLGGGPSSFRVGEALDPDLLDWSSRLLGDIGWTGLAMVEFKVGPDGPSLMEINARVWGSMPLATRSGVDFPALAAAVHLGERVAPPSVPYRVGVRSRDLRLELMWIAAVLRGTPPLPGGEAPTRGGALRVALRLALPQDGDDVLTLADPAASLAYLRHAVRHLVRKVRSSR